MVGATDLRFSLGLAAGSPDGDEPVFLAALDNIQRAANKNGLTILGFAVTPEIVRRRLSLGWKALICHADASGIFNSGTQIFHTYDLIADQTLKPSRSTYRLYGYEQNPRTRIIRIVAEAEGIHLDLCTVVPRDGIRKEEYMGKFPLSRGKIPGLEGPAGLRLTETLAIATYLAGLDGKRKLLGDGTEKQRAEILTWMSWANEELLPTLALWFLPSIPFSKDPVASSPAAIAKGRVASEQLLDTLETILEKRKPSIFLVGDHFTLADIMVVVFIARGMEWVLDETWRRAHQNIMRHFGIVTSCHPVKAIIPNFKILEGPANESGNAEDR